MTKDSMQAWAPIIVEQAQAMEADKHYSLLIKISMLSLTSPNINSNKKPTKEQLTILSNNCSSTSFRTNHTLMGKIQITKL